MQPLPQVPFDTRIKWIHLLSDIAKERGFKNYLLMCRALEHEAHSTRQSEHTINDIVVYRYGTIDILSFDDIKTHLSASLLHYNEMMRMCAWILKEIFIDAEFDAKAWLHGDIETIVKQTVHAEWQREFFQQQELARSVLSGDKTEVKMGIFACPKCKSFDVDTDQKQTRSADEPMTIFCCCNSCGQRFIR